MNDIFFQVIIAVVLVVLAQAMLTKPTDIQSEQASQSNITAFTNKLPTVKYASLPNNPFSDSDASNFGGTDFRSLAPKNSVVKSLEFLTINAFYEKYMVDVPEKPLTITPNRNVAVLVMEFPNGFVNNHLIFSFATVVQAIDVLTEETFAVSVKGKVIKKLRNQSGLN
ncbi:MAG: hypothetical protein KME60_18560 [Cyanomargarita calcarea GSE-NOS-MK-12-04C]|jgi:hypothetical protein|uniref:Uncharacterized protein n=1 Tax=Cyanomargarita calcarea GSE-NOS-MK-12-04C TaxID=2839659 RepID=A0A951UVY0_9CYAN|nr:hypothetical protein [Cyanomargarita calcarea GSE-NOS-MK-12-04C]